MEAEIQKILSKEINPKVNNDIIFTDEFSDIILKANYLKTIQMRIGKLWEHLAAQNGWEKVKKIDVINLNTKQAVDQIIQIIPVQEKEILKN